MLSVNLCVFLNAWTSLHETWYAHHGTRAHLNGVLYKPLPSASLYVYPSIVSRQRHGKTLPLQRIHTKNRRIVGRVVFMQSRVV
jgi:hypothetical protein